ncbi:MAG TPA: hypothetical protein PKL30_24305 [Leptospiraceae bacterium]|nr:hypothetical protein [Leptospiraceae bacterium]HMW08349.1 hypothetical protein [Leptospiraceae bacterium]HMX35583.1 hypothetical protein [Leptospiraceae bacterium]HMY34324.1 hypothetical protein [Leptospiraceae bacterium]HMZ67512.1 hypothetical protein [Leptospiraceae bacterium]
MKQILSKFEHGNTKYGADDLEKFQALRDKGYTIKQIIQELNLPTNARALGKFLNRNGIRK